MLKKYSLHKNSGMRVGEKIPELMLASRDSVHPQELINRGAKDRKRKRLKINDWLKKHGRTAKQVKKRKEKNDNNSRFYSWILCLFIIHPIFWDGIIFSVPSRKHDMGQIRSVKTHLIRIAGGYGGFIKRFGLNPWDPLPRMARNKPCICGSGTKHKKCCGSPHTRGTSIEQTLP